MSALSDIYRDLMADLDLTLRGPADTGLRVVTDLAATVDRRSVLVSAPSFAWDGLCDPDQPASMTYDVWLVEDLGERAVERLLDNLPALLAAVAQMGDETIVTSCVPGVFPSGTTDLPCYIITAETTF